MTIQECLYVIGRTQFFLEEMIILVVDLQGNYSNSNILIIRLISLLINLSNKLLITFYTHIISNQ